MNTHIQLKDISIMNTICDTCKHDFTSHSFNLISNTQNAGHVFYTKISNASKYDDTEGIVKHCTNYLNFIKPQNKWSWIIDFDGFGLKHTLGINTGIQLSKLINNTGNLKNLFVINTNVFVEQMLKMIKLTLNKEYHHCIVIIKNNNNFINEINEKWIILDNNKKLLINAICNS
jgi:hypothetical protein